MVATTDSRTVFDLSQSNGLFTVDSSQRVIATGSGTGTGTVIVLFTHESVNASVDITVVAYSALEITAVASPTYSGSGSTEVATLAEISGTGGVYEKATLSMAMRLTDGSSRSVSGLFTAQFANGSAADSVASISGGNGAGRVGRQLCSARQLRRREH